MFYLILIGNNYDEILEGIPNFYIVTILKSLELHNFFLFEGDKNFIRIFIYKILLYIVMSYFYVVVDGLGSQINLAGSATGGI